MGRLHEHAPQPCLVFVGRSTKPKPSRGDKLNHPVGARGPLKPLSSLRPLPIFSEKLSMPRYSTARSRSARLRHVSERDRGTIKAVHIWHGLKLSRRTSPQHTAP